MSNFVWPNGTTSEPRQTSPYGPRGNVDGLGTRPFHVGDDAIGFSAVCSIGNGTVVQNSWIDWAGWQVLVHYGNVSGNQLWVRYCHLASKSGLYEGQHIGAGHRIGTMGTTGMSTGVHLHWEMYLGSVDRGVWADVGSTVDPRAYTRLLINQSDTPAVPEEEEDDVANHYIATIQNGKQLNAIFNPVSGFCTLFESADGGYNTNIGRTLGVVTPSSMVSNSHFDRIVSDCADTRKGK